MSNIKKSGSYKAQDKIQQEAQDNTNNQGQHKAHHKVHPGILLVLFALSQSTESAFTTCLPTIAQNLHVDASLAQLSSTVYFFGFAFGIFVLGRVSDIIGRRPVVLMGLSLFLITNILIFRSTDIWHLLVLRFLQAFGASVGSVAAQAMARDSYSGRDLSKLYATLASLLAIMPSISSFIAGNILKFIGWRYVFIYLSVAVSIILAICAAFLGETSKHHNISSRVSFSEIFFALINDRKVVCYGAIIGLFNSIAYGFYMESPFIFMERLSVDPSLYGIIILLLGVSTACGGVACAYLKARGFRSVTLKKFSLWLAIFSCGGLFLIGRLWDYNVIEGDTVMVLLVSAMVAQSFSYSVMMPLMLRYSLEDYTKVNGTAGSIFGTYYYLIVAISTFVITRLHSKDIFNTTLLFFVISILLLIIYSISNTQNIKDEEKIYRSPEV